MREFRVYGPPGTGKTTYLVERLKDATRKFSPTLVRVVSFSRAAAREMAQRARKAGGLEIPEGNVSTLHAAMWRFLDRPQLAEASKNAKEWNDQHARDQSEVLGGKRGKVDGDSEDLGMDLLPDTGEPSKHERLGILRACMAPRDTWPADIQDFEERFRAWKSSAGMWDFTDLVEAGLDHDHAPGRPAVLFVDEAQDLSALELKVVRQWGESAQTFVVAGDDDQTIYTWRGASASALVSPELPRDQMRVLGKSYRLPRPILEYSREWIRRVERRVDKEFLPSDHHGEVATIGSSWERPTEFADIAEESLERGQSVMILASCGFMLDRTVAILRDRSIPFANPYRNTNGRWNPLQRVSDRVRAFAVPALEDRWWTWGELDYWLDACLAKKAGLVHGAKQFIEEMAKGEATKDLRAEVTGEGSVFASGQPPQVHPDVFAAMLKADQETILGYALDVWRDRGLESVLEKPRVCVGTIHSVKGAEADVVILLPDVSRRALAHDADPDDMIRTFYVGMTRARQRLILAKAAQPGLSAQFPAPG